MPSVKASAAQGSTLLPSSFGANTAFSSECYSLYVTADDNTGSLTWVLNPSTPTGFTVATSQGSMGGSITVNGATYPNGTTTQSLALNNGVSTPIYVRTNNIFMTASGASIPTVVANGYMTPGPPNAETDGADFALVSLFARNGDYVILQLNNGNGNGSGTCYCVRVETNGASGGSTISSSNITLTPGHRYSYSLLFDEAGGTAKLAIYDPSNGFAQVGSTVTVAQTTGGSFAEWWLGNAEAGEASGSTTYFEDPMLDWTNHTFPNYPQGGTGTAPNITSASSTTFTVGTAGTFTVTTTGSPTPTLTEAGTLPSGVTFSSSNGTGTLSGTPAAGTAGSYPLTFAASNGVGTAASQSFTLTVNQASQAPTITSASSTTFTVGTAGTFTVTTTGSPTPTLTETGTLPSGVTFSSSNGTGTLSGTPAAGTAGSYPLTFAASNGVGTAASQSFTLTVNQASQAPTITSASSTTFTVGTAGTFTVTTTGSPTPTLTETGTLPSGVTFSSSNGTGTLSGTPAAGTAGSYPLTFAASNGVGTAASQSFTLTVNQASQAPTITSASSTTFTVGTAGTFTVTTTGSPTPTLTETGTLPSGVTFSSSNGTGTLSGTPAAGTAGSYPLTFAASNGVGTAASQSFTLTVNRAPAITSASSTTFTVGSGRHFHGDDDRKSDTNADRDRNTAKWCDVQQQQRNRDAERHASGRNRGQLPAYARSQQRRGHSCQPELHADGEWRRDGNGAEHHQR